ncbi:MULTISPECIES: GNAT family N-acetyltransferase [unclassified Agarivorans]|uniref:GNAT family N-acetyltransferase n=1 Tax=unclassified Agarivorans TaxID=2636026 RepID=UPI003D7DCA4C
MEIRFGRQSDIAAITDIFNFYILNSYARFEERIFTLEDRQQWFEQFRADSKYQLYVACHENDILGFACSQQYRAIEAFDDTVEVTIYLLERAKGQRVGSLLYQRLFSELATQNVHRALSGIALPNAASIGLHQQFGFSQVGVFDQYAKKNGQYLSAMWLEKVFSNHPA